MRNARDLYAAAERQRSSLCVGAGAYAPATRTTFEAKTRPERVTLGTNLNGSSHGSLVLSEVRTPATAPSNSNLCGSAAFLRFRTPLASKTMKFCALLMGTTAALTAPARIKTSRKNKLSSVTFDEYQEFMVSIASNFEGLRARDGRHSTPSYNHSPLGVRAGPVHRLLRERFEHRGLPQAHEAL